MNTKTSSQFRTDVNGLRAWAVVAVVLYHFGVPGFSGGFVGVDVFFAISGFLMTGIIIKSLEKQQFSLWEFYLARGKRIIPALLVLCIVLLALGWRFLLPGDYKMLASHSIYSLSFLSNVEFWREAGYFDVASHQKWLLHTWSLSVEWQFYLLLPLLMWVTWRLRPGRPVQILVLGGVGIVSLLLCVVVTGNAPSEAFYLLPQRAWEMLAGGMVALIGPRKARPAGAMQLLHVAGLGLIAASVLLFDHQTAWPGWRAPMPVAATLMILFANASTPLTGSLLPQWLGARSYSLYLWHWPMVVGLVYVELQRSPLAIAAAIVATLVLGDLSFRWIENPSRRVLGRVRQPQAALAIGGAMAAFALPALLVWSQAGIKDRFSLSAELAAREAQNINPRKLDCHASRGVASPSCTYGNGGRQLILLGDSHADAIVTSVAAAGQAQGVQVMQWTYSGCPVVDGLHKTPAEQGKLGRENRCSDFIAWVDQAIASKPADIPVLIAGRYAVAAMGANETPEDGTAPHVYFTRIHPQPDPAYLQEFGDAITRSACRLAKARKVFMLRPIPEIGIDVPRTLSRRIAMGMQGDIELPLGDYQKRNAWVWKAQDAAHSQCGVTILDPLPALCKGNRCFGSIAGRPLYSDDNHLSEYGNRLLLPVFAPMMKAAATGSAVVSQK